MASIEINYAATDAFIAFSFIAAALLFAPVAWQFRHNNSGAAILGFWIIVGNLTKGISAIVWRDDALDKSPIWCDISTKIILTYSTACVCAALAIARFIAVAVSPTARLGFKETRRMNTQNYVFCFGVPIVMMATHIVYQPNRYAIVTTLGCTATYVLTWPTFMLWLIWAPIFAALSSMYSGYTCYRIWTSRREMRKLMASTGMPTSRFLRLVAMCCGYTAVALPLSIYYFIAAVDNGGPWTAYNWTFIHSGNDHQFSAPTQTLLAQPDFGSCLALIGAVIYGAFFSFAKEARTTYFELAKLVGLARFFPAPSAASDGDTRSGKVTEISLTPSRSQTSLDKGSLPRPGLGVSEANLHQLPQYVGPFQPVDGTDIEAQVRDTKSVRAPGLA